MSKKSIIFETVAQVQVLRRMQDYNTNNHHSFAPYCVIRDPLNQKLPKLMILDRFWSTYLSPESRCIIIDDSSIELMIVDSFRAINEPKVQSLDDDVFAMVYRLYGDQYHFDRYYPKLRHLLPQHIQIVQLSREWRNHLIDLSKMDQIDRMNHLDSSFSSIINDSLQKIGSNDIFMKLSTTSAKNDVPIQPYSSLNQIVYALTNNRELLRQLGRSNDHLSLILMPFNHSISSKNEFRVYVDQGKIRAICPQQWSSVQFFSDEDVVQIIEKIERLVNDVVAANPTMHSGVFDVYITDQAHLIEINTWGCFGPAGSSLFHWIKDRLDDFGSSTINDEWITKFRNVDLYNSKKLIDFGQ